LRIGINIRENEKSDRVCRKNEENTRRSKNGIKESTGINEAASR